MRWRKFASWCGFGLLGLLAGTVFVPWTVDLGILEPQIERWASDAKVREFAVEGRLNIDLGRQGVVVAEKIRLADADRTGDDDMLTIGYAEVRVDTWSLFRGPVRTDLIRIDNTDLRLTQTDSGEANWELAPVSTPPADEQGSDAVPAGVLVRQIVVDDARIVYSIPERVGPLDVQIDRLEQSQQPGDVLQVNLQGTVGGRDVSARGKVGSWYALLPQEDVEFELHAELDTLTITSRGRIDNLAAPRRPGESPTAQATNIMTSCTSCNCRPGV
jgi:hypothetical protein